MPPCEFSLPQPRAQKCSSVERQTSRSWQQTATVAARDFSVKSALGRSGNAVWKKRPESVGARQRVRIQTLASPVQNGLAMNWCCGPSARVAHRFVEVSPVPYGAPGTLSASSLCKTSAQCLRTSRLEMTICAGEGARATLDTWTTHRSQSSNLLRRG